MSVTDPHELKDTYVVEVMEPGHVKRGAASKIFEITKAALKKLGGFLGFKPKLEPGRCFICGKTEAELGHPLEAHHFGIEWSFAEAPIDWDLVKQDFPDFDWSTFDPKDPMTFVDNMQAQGVLLCKPHHTGKDEGIHNMPFSLWIMQRYLKDGYKFSELEVIHHAED